MPWFLHDFCNGFKIDVKIYGAEESLKESTQNWKYFETPLPKSWIIIAIPKIFEFKLLLVYKLFDMSKIQNKPLLSRTKVRNWKRVNDIGLTSRCIFFSQKRHLKFKEGNFVTLHNNIRDELQNFQSMPKIYKFSKSSMYRWISQINCSRVWRNLTWKNQHNSTV